MIYDAERIDQPGKTSLSAGAMRSAGFSGRIENVVWSEDRKQVLVYTNSKRVWRGNTRGDYWYFHVASGTGKKLGQSLPGSSLMFAKISPDGCKAAYVSKPIFM